MATQVYEDDVWNCSLSHAELESLLQDKHKIKKKEFMVKLVDESCDDADVSGDCVVEVSEFDEKVITEDFLEMYFESKKSGGGKGTIKNITMTNTGKAFVTFHDSEGNRAYGS